MKLKIGKRHKKVEAAHGEVERESKGVDQARLRRRLGDHRTLAVDASRIVFVRSVMLTGGSVVVMMLVPMLTARSGRKLLVLTVAVGVRQERTLAHAVDGRNEHQRGHHASHNSPHEQTHLLSILKVRQSHVKEERPFLIAKQASRTADLTLCACHHSDAGGRFIIVCFVQAQRRDGLKVRQPLLADDAQIRD